MNRREIIRMLPVAIAAGNVSAAADAFGGKSRLRNAICAYSYREEFKNKTLRYEDLVRIAVENDADGLDLTVYWMPPEPGDDFLMPLRRIAFRNAVEIYSISIRTDLCRPTKDLQDREVETISKWVDVAAKLGAGHIRVFGGAVPKGATEEQAAQWATEVLKRAADCSSKKGIVLGIENHGGVTEKAERILQIVKAVNSPWAGINLDTGNFKTNAFPQVEMCIPHARQCAGQNGDRAGRREARSGGLGSYYPYACEGRIQRLSRVGIRRQQQR